METGQSLEEKEEKEEREEGEEEEKEEEDQAGKDSDTPLQFNLISGKSWKWPKPIIMGHLLASVSAICTRTEQLEFSTISEVFPDCPDLREDFYVTSKFFGNKLQWISE